MPAQLRFMVEPKVLHPEGLPPCTGYGVYAAILAAVRAIDAGLALELHEARPKPFSATPVLDRAGRPTSLGGDPDRIEVGVLDDDLASPLLAAVPPGATVRIGHHSTLTITSVGTEVTTYTRLLEEAGPDTELTLEFVTPTTFRTGGGQGARRGRPFPVPELVFTGLATRWAEFGTGVPLDLDAVGEVVFEHLELAWFRLHTETYQTKVADVGFVGPAHYAVRQPEAVGDEALRAVSALARYAQIAGVGDRTHMGMGMVRPTARGIDGRGVRRSGRRPRP